MCACPFAVDRVLFGGSGLAVNGSTRGVSERTNDCAGGPTSIRACSCTSDRRYIMGHTHCNEVTAHDTRGDKPAVGMMVAGQGMEGCGK